MHPEISDILHRIIFLTFNKIDRFYAGSKINVKNYCIVFNNFHINEYLSNSHQSIRQKVH